MQNPVFKTLYANGFTAVPIVPHDKTFPDRHGNELQGGKTPGRYDSGKERWYGLSRWQNYLESPPDSRVIAHWEQWGPSSPGAGILTGRVVAVDIDITHPDLLEAAIATSKTHLGDTPFVRIGQKPLLVYRIENPLSKMKSGKFALDTHKNQQIEVLGVGQQFVAFGTHPKTKRPYEWPCENPLEHIFEDLPLTTEEKLKNFLAAFDSVAEIVYGCALEQKGSSDTDNKPASQKDEKGLLPFALDAIPNEDLHYDDWVRVGLAIKAALPDDPAAAFELFDHFSSKSDKYDPDATLARFETFNASKIGAGTIYHLAREHGWQQPVPDPQDEFGAVDVLPSTVHARENRQKLYYKTPSQITPSLDHIALVEDLLDLQSMSVLYGESNTGKTFVAMDIAFHIAAGKPWDGRRTQQGGVVYVAAEGGKSAENRIQALKQTHNTDDFPLYLVPCPVDLLRPNADTAPLIQLVQEAEGQQGVKIALVVIDTLSRAIAGGDENGSEDMGAFVRNLDRIRDATRAHVMVVHHTGKDRAKGARGHSLLRAATDTEIEIADKTLTSTKQRDMEGGKPVGFELRTVVLGQNAYGKNITSCVVEKVDIRAREEFDHTLVLEPRDALTLNAFMDILAGSSGGFVEQSVWGDRCKVMDLNRVPGCPPWPEKSVAFNTAFKRARDRLATLGYVTESGKKRWVAVARENGNTPEEGGE